MPHCVIECSAGLEQYIAPRELMENVFDGVLASALFAAKDVKVRTQFFEQFMSGANHRFFVHVNVYLLPGCTDEQKSALSDLVLAGIEGLGIPVLEISVQAIDLETNYVKALT
jgi:5-carboxymethyl-2-hydroxymuconate isomerase